MGFLGFALALLLLIGLVVGAWLAKRQYQRSRVQRIRDQARLKAIEGQLAGLRAALRISVAEHTVRRAMAMQGRDRFADRADHGEHGAS